MREILLTLGQIIGGSLVAFGLLSRFYEFKSIDWILFIPACLAVGLTTYILWDKYLRKPDEVPTKAPIRLVSGKASLDKELYKDPDSVVRGAKKRLVITGSRSRDEEYLDMIFSQVRDTEGLSYLRILYGPARKEPLQKHLENLVKKFGNNPKSDRFKAVEFPIDGDYPEKFICASECKVVIITQSITSPLAYDTAFVIDDGETAIRFVDQLTAAAEAQARAQARVGPDAVAAS